MTETGDSKLAPNATSTNLGKKLAPNVSNLLEIKLSLFVGVPKDEKKNLNKVERCGVVVYNFLRRINGMTLPPGKFDTPYDFSLDFKDVVSNEGLIVKASLEAYSSEFESNGLTCCYENNKLSISGTPENPMGFDGNLQVKIEGVFADVKTFERRNGFPVRCDLTVESSFTALLAEKKFVLNPDPDSLWEDNPTPENEPFKKPNDDVQYGVASTTPALTVLGASQRGRSHAQVGSFRDDHFLIRLGESPDDWNFVAVADGAGSARFSREGSKIACEACINDPKTGLATLFKSYQGTLEQEITSLLSRAPSASRVDFSCKLPQTNLQKLFFYSVRYAGEAIVNASKQANAKLSDFNTTCLCAAFKRLPKTEQAPARWVVLSYWVGDGGLAIFRPNGKDGVLALGTPDGGEFAGQTRFLTMKSELEEKSIYGRLRLAVVEDFQALVLATDGITDPFFPAEANLSDYVYWEKFWNETLPKEFPGVLDATKTPKERGEALLGGLKFKSKGNHDDRTLVLVLNDAFERRQKFEDETPGTEEKTLPDESCGTVDIDKKNVDVPATTDERVNAELSFVESERADSTPEMEFIEGVGSDNHVVDDGKLSLPSEGGVTECSGSDKEVKSDGSMETPVSQEGETGANTDLAYDTVNDVETSTSPITSPKNVDVEKNADVSNVEVPVSETPTDELPLSLSEITISVSETPTEELPPPPSEIIFPVFESLTEELFSDPCEIEVPVSAPPTEELAPPPSEIVIRRQDVTDEGELPSS